MVGLLLLLCMIVVFLLSLCFCQTWLKHYKQPNVVCESCIGGGKQFTSNVHILLPSTSVLRWSLVDTITVLVITAVVTHIIMVGDWTWTRRIVSNQCIIRYHKVG